MGIKIFLVGDVMTGRGIDQILPFPCPSRIYESYVKDACGYVRLAEEASGKIDYPVTFDYVWGDALTEIKKARPDVKIINLETSVTTSENYLPKGINYRMNPQNIDVLNVFGVDICTLANNHILDWGKEGLLETIDTLEKNNIDPAGAGKNLKAAKSPAVVNLKKGRILVFACAHPSSGGYFDWDAKENRPGLNLVYDLSENKIIEIKDEIANIKQKDDIVIFSIHWGSNWGYEIDEDFVDFAHGLIDKAGVDLVFGHSSHHFKGFEIYKNKLILYGAGDFINDYEGIAGYEYYRADLTLMYLPEIDLETKQLAFLTLVPMQIKKMRLNYADKNDFDWCFNTLQRESKFEGKLIKSNSRILWQSSP